MAAIEHSVAVGLRATLWQVSEQNTACGGGAGHVRLGQASRWRQSQ
jgi:hypothetical protein